MPNGATTPFPHFWEWMFGSGRAQVWTLDADHGSPLPAYQAMGSPAFPTEKEFEALRKAAALPMPTSETLRGDSLTITLRPQALALIDVN
jgi:xylan 1,4-beta-xylosidase